MGNCLVLTQLSTVLSLLLFVAVSFASQPASPGVDVPEELIAELTESERATVVASWRKALTLCPESPILIKCLRKSIQSLRLSVDESTQDRFYRALVGHFCRSRDSNGCAALSNEF